MAIRMCRLVFVGLLLAMASCALPPPAQDPPRELDPLRVEFRYDSRTSFPDGTIGMGDVMLGPRAGNLAGNYHVHWRSNDGQLWTGMAQEADGLLGITTQRFPREYPRDGDILGLAIYHISGGKLTGTKIEENGGARNQGPESLAGPASLNGRFEITQGGPLTPPGYVKITPNGATFLVGWINPPFTIYGVGLRVGDSLFVGYTDRLLPTIQVLCQTGRELMGLGTTGSRPTLSFLSMTPQGAAGPAAANGPCQQRLNTVERR